MGRARRSDVALALVVVIALAALGYALWPHASPLAAADPATVRIERPGAVPAGRPTVLIIDDGYTSGATPSEMSYGCLAANRMGWLCKTGSAGGTGYVSGGPADRFPLPDGSGMSSSFAERIARLGSLYNPDVVILDGGRFDLSADPGARFEATARTLVLARQTWPRARIVFVAPRFLAKPDEDLGLDNEVLDLLRQASGIPDLVIVDPIVRLKDTDTARLISGDALTPNSRGAKAISDALVDALAQQGFRPAA